MKKRYVVLFSLLFLMIPTYIAISYIVSGNSSPVVLQNLKTITVVSPNDAKYTLDFSENDPDCQLMYSVFSQKKGVTSLPSNLKTDRPFEFTYLSDMYSTTVKGYFSTDPSNCYLEYRNGVKVTYYRVNTDVATNFLDSDYSEGVYSHASIPTLIIGGKEVYPVNADWSYLTYSGNEKKATELRVGNNGVSTIGSVSSDFICNFSVAPDSVNVVIKRSDTSEVLYSGDVSGVENMSITENYDVIIDISAVWQKNDKDYYGSVSYTAKARLHQPPYFFLNEPQVKSGEFVIISGKNIINIDELEFSCQPEINFTPKFFKDGDYYRAIIPISLELGSERRNYKFTLKSDDTVEELDLLVLERSDSSKTVYNVSAGLLDSISAVSNPYINLYSSIKDSLAANNPFTTEYFVGRFDYGYKDGILRAEFGDHVKYSTKDTMFRSNDYFYAGSSKNSPVTSVNRGKVVFVGSFDYTGQLVVVDHGYGLLSWYWNLGSVEPGVAVGKILEKGDKIGYNGGGGLSESFSGINISIHVALTVFDVPVDLSPLTTEGVIIRDN